MPVPLPERDEEHLSDYIDNKLPAAEKTRLERRLAAEPELRDTLGRLRATVHALRSLPPVRVPRNFTLDRKAYGARLAATPKGSSYGILRWGTALATLLFAVVVAGDFLTRAALVAAPRAALAPVAAERVAAETAVATAAPAEPQADKLLPTEAPALAEAPATEPALSAAAPPTGGDLGQAGGAAESAAAPAPLLTEPNSEVSGTPAAEVAVAAQATGAPSATEATLAKSSLTGTPTPAPSETPAVLAQAVPAEATQALVAPAPAPTSPVPPPLGWLRLVEVALGVIALSLGLAAFWRRKRAG